MIGALIARELTISFRRGTVHLLALGQMLAALALVAGADRLAQQATPWTPPALGSTSPATQTGLSGAVAAHLDAAIFVGETVWLLLFCLVAVPAMAGPAIARERERGTLPVLLGTGATPLAIVGAKSVAVLAQTGVLLATGLPALGLVFVFGNPSPSLALGGVALLFAWSAGVTGLGIFCSALIRTSAGAAVATFATGLCLLVGPSLAPLAAAHVGLKLPQVAYRLSLPAAVLSLQPDLGRRLADLVPNGSWLGATGLAAAFVGPPWLPFAAACGVMSILLVLLASYAVARSPG